MNRNISERPNALPGFTIIELMFVILIIAIIGGIVAYNFVGAADKAKASATQASMKTVKGALSQYRAQYNSYPPTALGLNALVLDKLLTAMPQDSWGKDFDYYSPTSSQPSGYELISYGGDGQPNTADDIRVTPDDQ
jgi:general secretion pathway protein G